MTTPFISSDALCAVPTEAAAPTACLHCGGSLTGGGLAGYCCAGCRGVHALLTRAGLLRYYDLRGNEGEPARDPNLDRRDRSWLEPVAARLAASSGVTALSFRLQGLRCAACVWLIQELFHRHQGAASVIVNPGRGSIELCVEPGFELLGFVAELERFGYLLGEQGDVGAEGAGAAHAASEADDLLLRAGVCLALGGNAMMFAAAIYLGLGDGPLYRLVHALNFACASLAVLIGAPVFVRAALQALRRQVLHLELPITVGIGLTYGAALWSFLTGNPRAAYYDSLAVFIGLMLLGRWLKERIVWRNQRELIDGGGAHNVWARRVEAGKVVLVRAPELRAGDELLVPPGDLVPVTSLLEDAAALCSLDWINGESQPCRYAAGTAMPAGAFNAGLAPLRLRCQTDFARSPLAELLARTRRRSVASPRRYRLFSAIYVVAVLVAAACGLGFWWLRTGDLARGLEVATALCVVTCPCAIGIATPLGYDLVLAGLRRAGLFVRTEDFLDRALAVRQVVFDKTGTLTTGRLELVDEASLHELLPADRDALYTLVSSSAHPKSRAVARALLETSARLVPGARVQELPGEGLEAVTAEATYRLGRRAFAAPSGSGATDAEELVLSRDGRELCALSTREVLRPDARREVAELRADGLLTFVASGDDPARVRALAAELSIPAERAFGAQSPSDKAEWLARHDRGDTLMLGDGINDSLALERAFVSGTPSIDRAFLAWRSDFYFVTPGLAPVRLALRAARELARVVQRNQVFAVVYNLGAASTALLGLMRPWLAAVLMPLSSLLVLSATSLSLSARSRLWKS